MRSRSQPKEAKLTANRNANRRNAERSQVDVLMNRYLDGQPYLCVSVDLSRNGMRLRPLSGPADTSRFMGLQFQLPGSEEILNASGEKVRAHDSGDLAIRFTYVPAAAKAAIERYLAA